jgi:hypothetical protein
MNTVSGKVVATPSNLGVADLLVVLYDLDPNGKPEEVIGGITRSDRSVAADAVLAFKPQNELGSLGDRIGSVLTGKDGTFTITYEDSEFNVQTESERRPDLLLLVMTPEQSGKSLKDLLLFCSPEIRQNAGKSESYLIRIDESALKAKGLDLPSTPASTNAVRIASYQRQAADAQGYSDAVLDVQRRRIDARQTDLTTRKASLKKLLTATPRPAPGFTTQVAQNERVVDKLPVHVQQETERANAVLAQHAEQHKGVEVTFVLTGEERAALGIDPNAGGFVTLNRTQFDRIRSKTNGADGDNLVLTSDNPILKACLKKNDDTTRAQEVLVGRASPPAPPAPGGGSSTDAPVTAQEILALVRQTLFARRSQGDIASRADAGSVDASVNDFSLKRGPAELPSYYDFKTLQVAFGHVWQQLVDETPATLAAEVSAQAADLGYTIDLSAARNFRDVLGTVVGTFSLYSSPPSSVVAIFDITKGEWNACDPTHQQKLEALASAIEKANAGLLPAAGLSLPGGLGSVFGGNRNSPAPEGYRWASPMMAEQFAQTQKEQGELIIDYIRYNNDRSFHKILSELDQSLRSNYLFTVFGADDTAKAVNFGLLNTYRQCWEPTAYQVGDLVKSIPLAPKEERKYSLKTTFNRKRAEKEAKKNNTSLTQSQNTTSRAEAEIVGKAQSKSDFKLNAEASYAKWKVSSSLGLEAQKESSDTRKDFRESVLQATQEFKEERSVEISTEESYGTEAEESGSISNPNDELAVTYLFYELQKRCKVSEQLYRTMPVVLVAQDVPGPDEISEAWIISNDWILNRCLLDDSFRPALQYIAQKNVGDDFAVRELRRNLRTQRQLVESLKRELTGLRKEADNRYVALEAAIDKRVHEETDRETDSFWDDVGEFFGGDKESPEGAKSREMAARDAHEFAVEKSEKMSAAVQREVNTLHQLTDDYNKVMREHLDKKTMVARLETHIKNNIIYYIQAIWSLEPPDQRFMRLLNVEVPFLEFDGTLTCDVQNKPEDDLFAEFRNKTTDERLHRGWVRAKFAVGTPKRLIEVADLDNLLGYHGNYMVFALKKHNALTELMAMPYVDASFGAMDPDQLSNISLEDYARYVCALKEQLSPTAFDALTPTLKNWLKLLLADPLRNGDEVVIPTSSLYIEIMVSANTLLEDFKLRHREMDVYKVEEEVRMQALENLRYAKRILLDRLEDPHVDKQIAVQGMPSNTAIAVDDV